MRTKNYISILLHRIFVLTVLLFVLDGLTSFEIKSQAIKSFTYFGLLVLAPMTLIWNLWTLKTKLLKIISSILPTTALIGIMVIGPTPIILSSGSWKTQTVLYQNRHFTFKKVEFQMQDVGAFGFNKRTVAVIYLSNLFMIVRPVENDIDESVEWIKVDQVVNELGLKLL